MGALVGVTGMGGGSLMTPLILVAGVQPVVAVATVCFLTLRRRAPLEVSAS